MIILGKSKEDVGAQLEILTKKLLEHRGYKKVVTNILGVGGNEVDVQAEFPNPVLQNPYPKRIIAECKAWAIPISLPDWLKFLGKVFVEEANSGNAVDGLFVSLSGVNGAVAGSYDSLRQKKQNITLWEGESLTEVVTGLYGLPPFKVIVENLGRFTEKQYSSMELAYYTEQFFWVFKFQGGEIAVLERNGIPANAKLLNELEPALLERMQSIRLLDLSAEQQARERNRNCKKFFLTTLFMACGRLPKSWSDQEQSGFTIEELRKASAECISAGWVLVSGSKDYTFPFTPAQYHSCFVDVLRFLLVEALIVDDWERLTMSQLFKEMLNESFLAQVSIIQAHLPLDTTEIKNKLVLLISYSPSALSYAIRPDPMIVTHRINQPDISFDEDHDCNVFMRKLLRAFRTDFENGLLTSFFFNVCGLREVDVNEHYKLKDGKEIVLEHEVRQRRLIGEMDKSLGGGLLHIEALPEAPEPWDMLKPAKLPDSELNQPSSESFLAL